MHNAAMKTEHGSIFPIEGGKRHRAVIQYRDEFDRLIPKAFTCSHPDIKKRKATLIKRMGAWLKKMESRRPAPTMTVDMCCELYIERCEKKKRAKKTINGYRNHLKNHISPTIGHLALQQLKPGHVEMMLEDVPGLGGAKVNCRSFLRAAINKVAIKQGVLVTNPAALADPPEVTRIEREPISPIRFAEIVCAEPHAVIRALWLFMAGTGRRPSECRTITWEEMWEQEDGWWAQLLASKTPAGRKPFPIASHVMREVLALPRTSKYIFATSAGTPYNESNLRRAWIAALVRAGIPYTNAYQLRKMFGTQQARKSKDAVTRVLMGHGDIRTTKQFYIGAFPEDLRAAVERN